MYRFAIAFGISLSFSVYYGAYRYSLTLQHEQQPNAAPSSYSPADECPPQPPQPPPLLVTGAAESRALGLLEEATSLYIQLSDLRRQGHALVESLSASLQESSPAPDDGKADYVTAAKVLEVLGPEHAAATSSSWDPPPGSKDFELLGQLKSELAAVKAQEWAKAEEALEQLRLAIAAKSAGAEQDVEEEGNCVTLPQVMSIAEEHLKPAAERIREAKYTRKIAAERSGRGGNGDGDPVLHPDHSSGPASLRPEQAPPQQRPLDHLAEPPPPPALQPPSAPDLTVSATIIPSVTSAPYSPRSRFPSFVPTWLYHRFGFDGGIGPPSAALADSFEPGDCWASEGSEGQVGLYLSKRAELKSVEIEQGEVKSAASPKTFEVLGYKSVREAREGVGKVSYGTFTYSNEVGEAEEGEEPPPWERKQTFEVGGSERIRVVVLKILENWGEEDYTCLYRFRAYEKEDEDEDEDVEEVEGVEVEKVHLEEMEAEELKQQGVEKAEEVVVEIDRSHPVQDTKQNRPAGRKRGRSGRQRKNVN